MSKKVVVIGGGPAGLFAARLLALRHPSWSVSVFERTDPAQTFGFGVGLTGAALTAIGKVDPETCEKIQYGSVAVPVAEFRLPTESVQIPGFHRGVAVSRATMLQTLVNQAWLAGVEVHLGESMTVAEVIDDADLVIAADGVSSQAREAEREVFAPTISEGRGIYLWCGCDTVINGTVFEPVLTEHGVFTAHAYSYGEDCSTLVIESDQEAVDSLRTATATGELRIDDSDEGSLRFLSEAFAELLDGRPLIGNRSQWFRFRTVRCERWVNGKVVLLGDAGANADPSLGSGTKLAMESAIALVDALDVPGRTIEEALLAYERDRRPAVDRFQEWANHSQRWWDSFPRRLNLPPERIAFAFLTRLRPMLLDDEVAQNDLVRTALAQWAQVPAADVPLVDRTQWVLSQPLNSAALPLPGRVVADPAGIIGDGARLISEASDPWGEEADEIVARAARLAADGTGAVLLDGTLTAEAVQDRLDVAERIKLETTLVVGAVTGANRPDLIASGLVAGRIDFAVEVSNAH